jgi:hypothetical protein
MSLSEFFHELRKANALSKDTSGMPPVELPHTKKDTRESATGSKIGYSLEMRTSYFEPKVLPGGFIIDNVWRRLPINLGKGPITSVPIVEYDVEMARHGLFTLTVVEAHRWLLLAHMEAQDPFGTACVETRFVRSEFHYTYKIVEKGVSEASEARLGSHVPFHKRWPEAEEVLPSDNGAARPGQALREFGEGLERVKEIEARRRQRMEAEARDPGQDQATN